MSAIELKLDGNDLTPSQRALWTATDPFVLVAGGYGSGKTQALALKFLQLLVANWGYPGLILAPTWRTMWAITYRRIMTTLRGVLSRAELPRLVDRNGECYLDFGGAPVYLRSANNADGYDGLDVAWMLGDEARYYRRSAWHIAQGRVRVRCPQPQTAIVSTPEIGWLSDEFSSGRAGRRLITAPTRENAHNLAPGYIENLKLSYSARLWRALVEGIFTILEGAVYEAFDPLPASDWFEPCDVKPASPWFASRPVYLAVDPGYRRSSWLWIAENDDLQWVVFDEMQADAKTDAQCVAEVNRRGWPIDEVWCDPAAGATQSFEGASTLKLLSKIKVRRGRAVRTITAANREIAYGVDKTRVLLGDPSEGQPIRLKFAHRLLSIERGKERGIVKSLSSYRYPPERDGRAISDVPWKDGITDHDCDALRYWAVGRWACDQKLRRLDPILADSRDPGWRIAG